MKLVDTIRKYLPSKKKISKSLPDTIDANYYYQFPDNILTPIYNTPYTGEKTPGEMGAAKNYLPQYNYLRIRSWQSYLESEITQSIINKYILWVVGNGLRLQSEPMVDILKNEDINLNKSIFIKQTEERFKLWSNSRFSDFAQMTSLNELAKIAHKNALIGGDVLVILRLNNNGITAQLVDGDNIMTPFLDNKFIEEAKERGNLIKDGIEIDKKGEHIAYYVLTKKNYYSEPSFERILRKGTRTKRIMAFMVYGLKYRINEVRGIPMISALMETLAKIDRYKEATVGSAEERQKIAYSIEHGLQSTGENPILAKTVQARKLGIGEAPESKSTSEYEAAATKIAATTQKQVFNMPIDSHLKLLESKNELYFKEFYDSNIIGICAAIGIPFEVARSIYNSNYSASRAAIKDWEYSLKISRDYFSGQFYQNFYNLWLDVEILKGKIQVDGYLKAIKSKNILIIEAFRNSRWIGASVPHIDPIKEVKAERMKLGDETTPLQSYEQTTENLGLGDWSQNIQKIEEEKKLINTKSNEET